MHGSSLLPFRFAHPDEAPFPHFSFAASYVWAKVDGRRKWGGLKGPLMSPPTGLQLPR